MHKGWLHKIKKMSLPNKIRFWTKNEYYVENFDEIFRYQEEIPKKLAIKPTLKIHNVYSSYFYPGIKTKNHYSHN